MYPTRARRDARRGNEAKRREEEDIVRVEQFSSQTSRAQRDSGETRPVRHTVTTDAHVDVSVNGQSVSRSVDDPWTIKHNSQIVVVSRS